MKKNNLITEVDRIREIMGVSLINEQVWKTLGNEIADLAAKGADEMSMLFRRYRTEFSDLAKSASDEESLKILAKLANAEQKLADVILPAVRKGLRLNQEVNDELAKISSDAQKMLDNGESREAVDKIVEQNINSRIKTEFQGLKDLLKKEIKNNLDSYKPKPPGPVPPEPTDLQTQMEDTFKKWQNLAPGTLSIKDYLLLNDMWFRGLRYKINYLLNSLANSSGGTQKTLDKIVSLLKQADQLAKDGKDSSLLWRTINSEMEGLRKSADYEKELVLDMIEKELGKVKGIGPSKASEFVTKIKANPTVEGYESWMKNFLEKSYLSKMYTLPRNERGEIKWVDWLINFAQRTLTTLSTGNPRKFQEIFQEFFKKYGAFKGFFYWTLWMWTLQRTLWPVLKGFIDLVYYGWKNETGKEDYGEFWGTYGHFIKERFLDTFTRWQLEFDESTQEMVDKRTFDLAHSINPFEWLWDDLVSLGNWHVSGGTRRMFDNIRDRGEQQFQRLDSTGRAAVDSVRQRLERERQRILNLVDSKDSFVDYQIDAGYSPEDAENATESKVMVNGQERKVYTTIDGYKYWFNNGTFEPYE